MESFFLAMFFSFIAMAVAFAFTNMCGERVLHACLTWIITRIIRLETPILYEIGDWNHLSNLNMRLESGGSVSAQRLEIIYRKLKCIIHGLKLDGISLASGVTKVKVKKLHLVVSLKAWRKPQLLIQFDARGLDAENKVSDSCYGDLGLDSLSLSFQLDRFKDIVLRNVEILCGILKLKFRKDWVLQLTGSSAAGESASSTYIPGKVKVMLVMTVMEKVYPSFLKNANFTLRELTAECVEDGGVSHVHGCTGLHVTTQRLNLIEDSCLEVKIELNNVNVVEATGFTNLCIAKAELYAFVYTSAQLATFMLKLDGISSYLALEEAARITTFTTTLEEFELIVESGRITFLLTSQQYHKLLRVFSKPDEEAEVKDWRELVKLLPVPVELRVSNVELCLLGDGLNGIAIAGVSGLIMTVDWPDMRMVARDLTVRSLVGGEFLLSRRFPENRDLVSLRLSIGIFEQRSSCNVVIHPIKIMLSRPMKEVIERYFYLPSDSDSEEKELTYWDRFKTRFAWLTRKKSSDPGRDVRRNYFAQSYTTIEQVEVEVNLQGFLLDFSQNILVNKYRFRHDNATCGEVLCLIGNHFKSEAFKSIVGLKNKKMKATQKQREYMKQFSDRESVYYAVFSRSDPSAPVASASHRWKPELTMDRQLLLARRERRDIALDPPHLQGYPAWLSLPHTWHPLPHPWPPLPQHDENRLGTDWSGFPEALPLPVPWPDTPLLSIEELYGRLSDICVSETSKRICLQVTKERPLHASEEDRY